MLFRREIEPRCAYCARGAAAGEREVVCPRKGVVSADYRCSRFRYDPLRRTPPRPVKLKTGALSEEDFRI